jgi:hypothetical protein
MDTLVAIKLKAAINFRTDPGRTPRNVIVQLFVNEIINVACEILIRLFAAKAIKKPRIGLGGLLASFVRLAKNTTPKGNEWPSR